MAPLPLKAVWQLLVHMCHDTRWQDGTFALDSYWFLYASFYWEDKNNNNAFYCPWIFSLFFGATLAELLYQLDFFTVVFSSIIK